jgi:hypothetical protein
MYISLLTTILCPILAGACCIYVFLERSKREHYLRKKGVRAEGIIFDFADTDQDFTNSSGSSTAYPVIRFVTQSGEWITKQYTITHSSLRQGDKVTVYYDTTNPREFYVEIGGIGALLPAILVTGIAATGFGLYNLVQYLLR